MRLAVDFDGTVAESGPYDLSPPTLRPGARQALWQMRAAGHEMVLWSARANRASRFGDQWDPVVRAGHRRVQDTWLSAAARDLAGARYWQMVEFVDRELPGVFLAVDDGMQGKPVVDLFVDDRAYPGGAPRWDELARELGEAWTPARGSGIPLSEGSSYADVLASVGDALPVGGKSVTLYPVGWTKVGPMLAVQYTPAAAAVTARVAVIAAQHGEEQAGVAAICDRWPELLRLAEQWSVALRVYPCVNPEGFEDMTRFNRRRQEPTNAAIEYEVSPGRWLGEVDPGERWLSTRRCARASDESRWLVNDLERYRPDVVLDLHGDSDVPAGGAFAYVFGERAPYADAMRRSGARPYAGQFLRNASWTDAAPKLKTDDRGLCSFNDGSVTAWAWLAGARLATCVETSLVAGDFERAAGVAWGWVRWAVEAGGRGVSAGNLHPGPEDRGGVSNVVPFDRRRGASPTR